MTEIPICKIRPISWKVYVQGEQAARQVRRVLAEAGVDTTEPKKEPGLAKPPLYAMVATLKAEVSFTQEELVAVLQDDEQVQVAFEAS